MLQSKCTELIHQMVLKGLVNHSPIWCLIWCSHFTMCNTKTKSTCLTAASHGLTLLRCVRKFNQPKVRILHWWWHFFLCYHLHIWNLIFSPLFSPSTVSASRNLVSSLPENRPVGIHEGFRWLILQQDMTRRQGTPCLLLHNLKVEVWKMKTGSSVLYRYVGVLVPHSQLCRMSADERKE